MTGDRLRALQVKIRGACDRSGRNPETVKLVAISKGMSTALIREAYDAGLRHFGENRVQEYLGKREELPRDIHWHLVGSLQTNKVKQVVGTVELIHSCDRLALAEALHKEAQKQGRSIPVLLQVNTTGEEMKHGFLPDAVGSAAEEIAKLSGVKIEGLMTIGPFTEDKQRIRDSFRRLRTLRDQLKAHYGQADLHFLSMGMTGDFEIAIEEGADLIRIGTGIFGERPRRN
jgi:PLP dependent protein